MHSRRIGTIKLHLQINLPNNQYWCSNSVLRLVDPRNKCESEQHTKDSVPRSINYFANFLGEGISNITNMLLAGVIVVLASEERGLAWLYGWCYLFIFICFVVMAATQINHLWKCQLPNYHGSWVQPGDRRTDEHRSLSNKVSSFTLWVRNPRKNEVQTMRRWNQNWKN